MRLENFDMDAVSSYYDYRMLIVINTYADLLQVFKYIKICCGNLKLKVCYASEDNSVLVEDLLTEQTLDKSRAGSIFMVTGDYKYESKKISNLVCAINFMTDCIAKHKPIEGANDEFMRIFGNEEVVISRDILRQGYIIENILIGETTVYVIPDLSNTNVDRITFYKNFFACNKNDIFEGTTNPYFNTVQVDPTDNTSAPVLSWR